MSERTFGAPPTPGDATTLIKQAIGAVRAGDWDRVEQLAELALRLRPEDPMALMLRASAAARRGDHASAAEALGRVVALDPRDREAAANYAVALAQLGRFAEVRSVLQNTGPWRDRPDLELLQVRAAIECGSFAEARSKLRKLEAAHPKAGDVFFHRGLLAERQRRWRDAVTAFGRAADLSNDDPDSVIALLRSALSLGDPVELTRAMARAERGIKRQPALFELSAALAAALVQCGRLLDAENCLFAASDAASEPWISDNSRINRLIALDRHSEAAALVADAVARSLPQLGGRQTPPPRQPTGAHPITGIVLHNGHHLMRHADADDLSDACGLPVRLLDLYASPPSDYAAPGTLVVYASGIEARQSYLVHRLKEAAEAGPVAAWLFDNHHCYLWNALLVGTADVSFPAHRTEVEYLSRWAGKGGLGPIVPLALKQWPRPVLAALYRDCRDEPRSSSLTSRFAFYPVARRRNLFLAEVMAKWPDADITLKADWSYHERPARERFLSWRRYKTSAALPVAGDLSMRFFDALAAGQVPIVPRDILDFDRVVPPGLQADLPVIRLEDYTVEALRAAHADAVAAFDRGGAAQAEYRHRYVLGSHMLAHRLREIADRAATLCGLELRRA